MHDKTTRRVRQIAHTREDIFQAAARAFARRGFEATTMQDIAKEAGYTVVSLYAYFKNREAIVDGLVRQLTKELLQTFELSVSPSLTFAEKLKALLHRQFEMAESWQEAFTAFLTLKPSDSQILGKKGHGLASLPDLFVGRLTEWISQNAGPQEIGGRDPEEVACILKGILHAFCVQSLHGAPRRCSSDCTELIVNTFLYGVTGPRFGVPRSAAPKKQVEPHE